MQKNQAEYKMARKHGKRTKRMSRMRKLNEINKTKNAAATGVVRRQFLSCWSPATLERPEINPF